MRRRAARALTAVHKMSTDNMDMHTERKLIN